jgi:hypothetical protein
VVKPLAVIFRFFSLEVEWFSVQGSRRLHRNRIDERLERKTGLFTPLDQVSNLVRRLARLDVNVSLKTKSAASQGALERYRISE